LKNPVIKTKECFARISWQRLTRIEPSTGMNGSIVPPGRYTNPPLSTSVAYSFTIFNSGTEYTGQAVSYPLSAVSFRQWKATPFFHEDTV
jgi:hypothetical protein